MADEINASWEKVMEIDARTIAHSAILGSILSAFAPDPEVRRQFLRGVIANFEANQGDPTFNPYEGGELFQMTLAQLEALLQAV